MPKNYKQRPTELNPYANSAHIHGEHIVQLLALYLDILSVQSLSTLAASLPTLFLAFLFLFPLSRCVRRVSLLLDFPFLFVRCVFFLCLVVDAVICIILILERDQWGQTLSGCQPYFSVLCCNRLCLRCRNYRALQLQPHTYVDRPYTHRINRNAKQTESERMNDRRIERANFVIAAKTVATVTQTFIIFNTTTCTFLHASRWMTPKTKYKILLHIHTD